MSVPVSAADPSSGSALTWLVPLLRCPICHEALRFFPDTTGGLDGTLGHESATCAERYPVIDEIPRLVTGAERRRVIASHAGWFARDEERGALGRKWTWGPTGEADRTVSAFDYEWRHFAAAGTAELASVFDEYFDLIAPERFVPDQLVLDAGCGAGRWALEVARRGPRVIAVDLGESVEVARRNTASTGRVACVQADLQELPLATASADWAYSLGVLHHLADPPRALARIVDVVRGNGPVLIYVYYALDHRGPFYRTLFRVTSRVRRVTSALPRPLTLAFAAFVALTVYWPLARLARVTERLGWTAVATALPLAYYRKRSLGVMLNDSLDRFGTRIELRFTRRDVAALYDRCGVANVVISPRPPFWHAIGWRAP